MTGWGQSFLSVPVFQDMWSVPAQLWALKIDTIKKVLKNNKTITSSYHVST